MPLSEQRKSLFPQTSDTWVSIARRELKDLPEDQAVSSLQSWNLHVFMRPSTSAGTGSSNAGEAIHAILPSDIIFLEAPLLEAPVAESETSA